MVVWKTQTPCTGQLPWINFNSFGAYCKLYHIPNTQTTPSWVWPLISCWWYTEISFRYIRSKLFDQINFYFHTLKGQMFIMRSFLSKTWHPNRSWHLSMDITVFVYYGFWCILYVWYMKIKIDWLTVNFPQQLHCTELYSQVYEGGVEKL